jgi:hypothetical protein
VFRWGQYHGDGKHSKTGSSVLALFLSIHLCCFLHPYPTLARSTSLQAICWAIGRKTQAKRIGKEQEEETDIAKSGQS